MPLFSPGPHTQGATEATGIPLQVGLAVLLLLQLGAGTREEGEITGNVPCTPACGSKGKPCVTSPAHTASGTTRSLLSKKENCINVNQNAVTARGFGVYLYSCIPPISKLSNENSATNCYYSVTVTVLART